MCRLSWNLGSSTSLNPQGLSRSLMGLLYLYHYLPRMQALDLQCFQTRTNDILSQQATGNQRLIIYRLFCTFRFDNDYLSTFDGKDFKLSFHSLQSFFLPRISYNINDLYYWVLNFITGIHITGADVRSINVASRTLSLHTEPLWLWFPPTRN